jgi:hypothetical protein
MSGVGEGNDLSLSDGSFRVKLDGAVRLSHASRISRHYRGTCESARVESF